MTKAVPTAMNNISRPAWMARSRLSTLASPGSFITSPLPGGFITCRGWPNGRSLSPPPPPGPIHPCIGGRVGVCRGPTRSPSGARRPVTSRRARPIAFSVAGLMAGLGLLAFLMVPQAGHGLSPWSATASASASAERCRALIKEGRAGEAEVLARGLVARAGDGDSPQVAEALDLLVEALMAQVKWRDPQAIDATRRALAIRERILGGRHPHLLPGLLMLADLSGRAGDRPAALEIAKRAV